LGEILARLKVAQRVGFDRSAAVLRAARRLHPGIRFVVGSFADVDVKADILIAVNFIHAIPPEELKRMLLDSAEKAQVQCIVVDRVAYTYYHDMDAILGPGWERMWESQAFPNSRQVLCYQRRGIARPAGAGLAEPQA
jgi:trans-aconitate methyltransferase